MYDCACTAAAPHSREGGQSLDERLLASLVQDVWDKFCGQRRLLLDRQRHEAEAMWMLQHQQWTDRLKDLGEMRRKLIVSPSLPFSLFLSLSLIDNSSLPIRFPHIPAYFPTHLITKHFIYPISTMAYIILLRYILLRYVLVHHIINKYYY